MSAAAIIEAQDLHTYYGTSHVLHGIDFAVRQGEVVGLMGRNGMGKTTLIRTLLGLVPARRGAVRIDGQDMTHAAPHRIAGLGIAYVPEERGIFASGRGFRAIRVAASSQFVQKIARRRRE